MRSTLSVTTPAADLQILSDLERRDAAGVSDASQDVALLAIGLGVAAAIVAECNIATGAGGAPTLARERLTETFLDVQHAAELILSRRHEVSIVSLTQDGSVLDAADYMVDAEAGILTRLRGGCVAPWCAQRIVVVYDAGFSLPPADMKLAAAEMLRSVWLGRARDPLVKSERVAIPDVRETQRDYWVGSVPGASCAGPVPDAIAVRLKRYRNVGVM